MERRRRLLQRETLPLQQLQAFRVHSNVLSADVPMTTHLRELQISDLSAQKSL